MARGRSIYIRAKSDIILEMLRQYDDYYDQVMAGLPDSLPVDGRLEEIVRAACRFTEQVIGLDLIRVLYSKQLTAGARNPGLLNEDRALSASCPASSPRDSAQGSTGRSRTSLRSRCSCCTASVPPSSSGAAAAAGT